MSFALIEPGPTGVGVTLFVLLAAFCFTDRRVDRSLAVLGLYLGLLDGYLKLRTGSSVITLARDVLVIAIAGGALLRTLTSNQRLPLPPLGGFVLAFSAIVLVEVFNPEGRPLASGLAGVRQHLEFVPLFFLGYAFMRSEAHVRKLLFVLVACAAVGGFVSYIQSTLTTEQFANWGPGYRERIYGQGIFSGAGRVAFGASGGTEVRPFGLGSDLGAGAAAAALAIPALIAIFMRAHGWARLAIVPLAIGIGLAVATSGSRAAQITVFASAAAFGLVAAASRNVVRVIAGLTAGTIVVYGAFAFLGSDNTTAQRAQSIAPTRLLTTFSQERASGVLKFDEYAYAYPLGLGVGSVGPAASAFGRVSQESLRFNVDTEWNFLIVETGLAGLAVFLALCLRLMTLALTRIRHIEDQRMRLQLAALAAPIFGLVVAGFGGPFTASVPTAPYFWFVSGVLSYWLVTNPMVPPESARAHHEVVARQEAQDRWRRHVRPPVGERALRSGTRRVSS